MKKLLVAIIILLLIIAVGVLSWKLWEPGESVDITIPDVKELRNVMRKDTIGVKEEADGSYTFTDTPTEGMEMHTLPSPRKFKEDDGYYYEPGIIFPPESKEDE